MEKILDIILKRHVDLFGENPVAKKINTGFTNTIYAVNDKFILKICTRENNDAGFIKETEFYKSNRNTQFFPILYFANTTKEYIPYCYEILEKLDGVSLYNLWHTFSDEQQQDTILQLCEILKTIHIDSEQEYDWVQYNKDVFLPLLENANKNQLFTLPETNLLKKAYSLFDQYLPSDRFTVIHNDLHFDNIIYLNGKIKLIDFERSMIAPADYELDILYRMVRKPWKFASGETEKFTHPDQYKTIMEYMTEFYPQLFDMPHLYKRLAVYDMIYFLKQYVAAPQYNDLKEDVLIAANSILTD